MFRSHASWAALAVLLLSIFIYAHSLEAREAHERLVIFEALNPSQKILFLKDLMDQEGIVAGWKLLEHAQVPRVGPLPYYVGTYIYKKHGSAGIKLCPDSFL